MDEFRVVLLCAGKIPSDGVILHSKSASKSLEKTLFQNILFRVDLTIIIFSQQLQVTEEFHIIDA